MRYDLRTVNGPKSAFTMCFQTVTVSQTVQIVRLFFSDRISLSILDNPPIFGSKTDLFDLQCIKGSSSAVLVAKQITSTQEKNLLNHRTSATTVSQDEVTTGELVVIYLFVYCGFFEARFFQAVVVTNWLFEASITSNIGNWRLSWELAVMFCEFTKRFPRV